MKIPCDILRRPTGEAQEVRVLTYFSCLKLKLSEWVYFLLDTGAWSSLISESDAKRLGIDYSSIELLPEKDWALGVGGKSPLYRINAECSLSLGTKKGGHFTFQSVETFDHFNVIKIPDDAKDRAEIMRLPSLLGINILTKYSLHISKDEAYIENERK